MLGDVGREDHASPVGGTQRGDLFFAAQAAVQGKNQKVMLAGEAPSRVIVRRISSTPGRKRGCRPSLAARLKIASPDRHSGRLQAPPQ